MVCHFIGEEKKGMHVFAFSSSTFLIAGKNVWLAYNILFCWYFIILYIESYLSVEK